MRVRVSESERQNFKSSTSMISFIARQTMEAAPKLDNDSSDADTSTDDDEEVDASSVEVDAELASLLQNVPRKPQKKGEEMILESKSRLRQLIK